MDRKREPSPSGLRIPKYRRHKPTGLGVVTIAGRDVYLGKFGTKDSRAAYQRAIAEWLASGEVQARKRTSGGPELTVDALIARYWEHLERKHGADVAPVRCESDALAFRVLHALYGPTPAAEFGPRALKAVQAKLVRDGTPRRDRRRVQPKGLSRKEANRRVQRIRRMFRWAVAEELVPADLHHSLAAVEHLVRGELGAREQRRIQPVPWEHVEPILAHVSAEVRAMIELLWITGARAGEIVQLRPCDIERGEGTWTFRPTRHKSEHRGIVREIPLGPKAQEVLRPFLERVPQPEPDAPLFSPQCAEQERSVRRRIFRRTPMTPSQRRRRPKKRRQRAPGNAYDVASLRRAIERGVEQANCVRRRDALRRVFLDAYGPAASCWIDPLLANLPALGWPKEIGVEPIARLEALLARVDRAAAAAGDEIRPTTDVLRCRSLDALRALPLIPCWHPHRLRHSAATRIRAEFGIEAARVVLGHTSPGVTALYAEVDREQARRVAQQVG